MFLSYFKILQLNLNSRPLDLEPTYGRHIFQPNNICLIFQIESLFIKQIKFPDSITEDNYTAYYNALEFVQGHLKSRGTKFIDGNEPGYADYMIWPFFERLRTFDNNAKMRIDEKKYPLLVSISTLNMHS